MINPRLTDFFYNRQKGWIDGTALFMDIVKRYCGLNFMVLDLGAGSGEGRPKSYSLKGLVKVSIGVDINKGLYKNEIIDKKVLWDAYSLPFKKEAFDLIYCDYVLEHIKQPQDFMEDLGRVLKKGGFFIFRTPNLYHYVPLIAKVASRLPKSVLADYRLKNRNFPAFYKMNTVRKLKMLFLKNGFSVERIQLIEKEPSYLMFAVLPFLAGVLYERIVNFTESFAFLRSNIIGVFKKC
ncbi:MAG: class I SAM-dependent methyltransferase [Candidatus Omnitrophica bacterium]|nr:class I SAM-dependent methyltransferase [Candidatus Omnitrophota bacterium]